VAQTLTTNIVINAQTGNGFSQVGATLTELGSLVNGISSQLIEFGKDSVNVYREYEKSMTDAEVALSTTYGKNTAQLSTVMGQLDQYATEWAASSIFHTNDVANAISEAAHAGWDFDHIMAGIPAAMELAQAGGLDLSQAVDYIVKSSNSLGLELDADGNALRQFVDLWAFAANSSASTIGEFGDAMLRMGSTMRFTDSTEELMTLIAVTANAGSTGSEAGTMIRNSIMRLAAPTDKAAEVLGELGATSDEVAATLEDEALAAANARLAAQGFSAYDQEGNLKPVLDIYRDLYMALGEVNGGFENIEENEDVINILHDVFQNRSLTEALTLLRGASEGYDGLYEKMRQGEAEGYGAYAAEKMINTLDGSIEIFESKVERLKQITGQEISGPLMDGLQALGDVVDGIAGLDEGTFSAIVAGLEVIAAAGPGLLLAGGAMRVIGLAMNPITAAGLGIVGLAAAISALEKFDAAQLESKFGNMNLDDSAIMGYVNGLSSGFDEAYSEVDSFRQALDQSVASYETAATTFSSNLLTDMLTKNPITQDDIKQYETLGQQMGDALKAGIENSTAASLSYWDILFGEAKNGEGEEAYNNITNAIVTSRDEAIAEATAIGNELRAAMNKAFSDGEISDPEYQNILRYVESYNAAIAKAQREAKEKEDYIEKEMLLHKAQTASKEEIDTMAQQTVEARDTKLQESEDMYLQERLGAQYDLEKSVERGEITKEEMDAALAEADKGHQQEMVELSSWYDDVLLSLYDSQIKQSELGNAYTNLESLASQYISGNMSAEEAVSSFSKNYGFFAGNAKGQLNGILQDRIEMFGGTEGLQQKIQDYIQSGDKEHASDLLSLYTMAQIAGNFETESTEERLSNQANSADYWNGREERKSQSAEFINQSGEQIDQIQPEPSATEQNQPVIEQTQTSQPVEMQQEVTTEFTGAGFIPPVKVQAIPEIEEGSMAELEPQSMTVNPVVAGVNLDLPPAPMEVTPQVDESSLPNMDPQPLPIEPYVEGTDALSSLENQGVDVQVDGDVTSLSATINSYDAMNLLEYVDGDASGLEMSITAQDGRTITTHVSGDTSDLRAKINSLGNQTVYVNVVGRKLFAEGGRATEASVFGEAGAEWAIPEEHTEKTANLLNSAMTASGFTWAELASMYPGGSGNAGGNSAGSGMTLVYSPTIHAENVSGVSEELKLDKKRLDQWYAERQLRDRMEVYA
jgi:TP901 family phage tail tape measure protein